MARRRKGGQAPDDGGQEEEHDQAELFDELNQSSTNSLDEPDHVPAFPIRAKLTDILE